MAAVFCDYVKKYLSQKLFNSAVSFAIKKMNIVKLQPLDRMYMKKNKIRLDRDIDVLYGLPLYQSKKCLASQY